VEVEERAPGGLGVHRDGCGGELGRPVKEVPARCPARDRSVVLRSASSAPPGLARTRADPCRGGSAGPVGIDPAPAPSAARTDTPAAGDPCPAPARCSARNLRLHEGI
jgi:hypothetical protein